MKITAINGQVLKWARERSGLSPKDVAEKFSKDESLILAWEAEDDFPTYAQLEKIAYKIYKRPLAIFFFPEPPEDKDPKIEFRLIPEFEMEKLGQDALFSIRQMQARQESLKELTEGQNPSVDLLTTKVKLTRDSDIQSVCSTIRDIFGISIDEQSSWANTDIALKKWRLAVESAGIFVFKKSFKQKGVNGFCLTDSSFPIICINNSTSKSRQVFTLFHELAHILTSFNGYTKDDLNYMNSLLPDDYAVEVMCNRFAAEFLVPLREFDSYSRLFDGSDESIGKIAGHFNVSREVILRRFLDSGDVNEEFYLQKQDQWNKEWFDRPKKKAGGDYYRTQAAYLGDTFLKLCFGKYYSGQITKGTLADCFGIRAKNISKLENVLLGA